MTIGTAHRPRRSLVRDELRRLVITGEPAPGTRIVEAATPSGWGCRARRTSAATRAPHSWTEH